MKAKERLSLYRDIRELKKKRGLIELEIWKLEKIRDRIVNEIKVTVDYISSKSKTIKTK